MVDFDTIDKYVAAVKRGGVAIQMKQFHNLDRFIEEVVYDFKEYADIDLTEEQKEYGIYFFFFKSSNRKHHHHLLLRLLDFWR